MICEVKIGDAKLNIFQVLEIRVSLKKHIESMQEQLDAMKNIGVDQKLIDSHLKWMSHAAAAAAAFESVTPV